ncbi:hypothetical protein NXX50_00365, partial [Bacteroides fragilis]|nr:hypothetical protein [Bacteroides fragilis]
MYLRKPVLQQLHRKILEKSEKYRFFELAFESPEQNWSCEEYGIGANIATNKNKIYNLGGSDNRIQTSSYMYIVKYHSEKGESINTIPWIPKADPDFILEEANILMRTLLHLEWKVVPNAGDIKFVPQRDIEYLNQEIADEDRTILGKRWRDFTYGVN